jgi:homoserine kinase
LLGGLVVLAQAEDIIFKRFEIPPIQAAVLVPDFPFPTREARAALPASIKHGDAVFNIGRAVMVVEALRSGDLGLLAKVMEDRIHEPYRLKLIPGAAKSISVAKEKGVSAALSGAGPGVIAFVQQNDEGVVLAMQNAFEKTDQKTRIVRLSTTNQGAWVK